MIIIKLQGGLGNQMFQYAAAKRLAIKHNVDLLLDHSYLERNNQDRYGFTARSFELDVFNITAKRFLPTMVDEIFDAGSIQHFQIYNERPVSYDSGLKKAVPFTYLSGYFHSYKYFNDISDLLRAEFSFKDNALLKTNSKIIDQITNTNSVAIHIRRGDYVTQADIHKLYSICSLEYYKKTMDIMVNKYDNVNFFVFSDDIEWAKQNVKYARSPIFFIGKNEKANWLDMHFMSICKHNIIANSTFSWWAAWLNRNKDKTVITPKKWFQSKREGIYLNDLCPKHWVKL